MSENILVTGGAGFIGSNFVLDWVAHEPESVVNLDALTYAGNLHNLDSLKGDRRHVFVKGSVDDRDLLADLLRRYQPRAIVHFAAETHVDRSIYGPENFVQTNVVGTFQLLQAALEYWLSLPQPERTEFRFLHVSTDEVFGSLEAEDPAFCETTPYNPRSPYAASKAASDHLVRAYGHTYGLPTLITNCSNNYGPFQFPEKLIPLMICNALNGERLPIYGDGMNVRDWLHVADHCDAIRTVLRKGTPGESYNIGGRSEKANIEVIETICEILDDLQPRSQSYRALMTFVKDRPGHDRRYAMNCAKIERTLGWTAKKDFPNGIRETVQWYLDNQTWVQDIISGEYRSWIELNYAARASQ